MWSDRRGSNGLSPKGCEHVVAEEVQTLHVRKGLNVLCLKECEVPCPKKCEHITYKEVLHIVYEEVRTYYHQRGANVSLLKRCKCVIAKEVQTVIT